jgi:anti-sigma factor RsiW
VSPRRHVDNLFTGAHDDDLSAIDEARFQHHLRECSDCAAAYAEFTATVEALRELPRARMPRVVHLPSTAPVAERSSRGRFSLGWLNAGLLRRFPATAIAGAAAAVIIIVALVHGVGPSGTPNSTASLAGPEAGSAGSVPASVGDAACTQQITPIVAASPPVTFALPAVATDARQPGTRLVLAASALSVTAGQPVTLYAQLTLPVTSLGLPGSTTGAPATRSVRPCVSIEVGDARLSVVPSAAGGKEVATPAAANGEPAPQAQSPAALLQFTVPAGYPPGTQIRVVATIPAGYEGLGAQPLTATLTLTTR